MDPRAQGKAAPSNKEIPIFTTGLGDVLATLDHVGDATCPANTPGPYELFLLAKQTSDYTESLAATSSQPFSGDDLVAITAQSLIAQGITPQQGEKIIRLYEAMGEFPEAHPSIDTGGGYGYGLITFRTAAESIRRSAPVALPQAQASAAIQKNLPQEIQTARVKDKTLKADKLYKVLTLFEACKKYEKAMKANAIPAPILIAQILKNTVIVDKRNIPEAWQSQDSAYEQQLFNFAKEFRRSARQRALPSGEGSVKANQIFIAEVEEIVLETEKTYQETIQRTEQIRQRTIQEARPKIIAAIDDNLKNSYYDAGKPVLALLQTYLTSKTTPANIQQISDRLRIAPQTRLETFSTQANRILDRCVALGIIEDIHNKNAEHGRKFRAQEEKANRLLKPYQDAMNKKNSVGVLENIERFIEANPVFFNMLMGKNIDAQFYLDLCNGKEPAFHQQLQKTIPELAPQIITFQKLLLNEMGKTTATNFQELFKTNPALVDAIKPLMADMDSKYSKIRKFIATPQQPEPVAPQQKPKAPWYAPITNFFSSIFSATNNTTVRLGGEKRKQKQKDRRYPKPQNGNGSTANVVRTLAPAEPASHVSPLAHSRTIVSPEYAADINKRLREKNMNPQSTASSARIEPKIAPAMSTDVTPVNGGDNNPLPQNPMIPAPPAQHPLKSTLRSSTKALHKKRIRWEVSEPSAAQVVANFASSIWATLLPGPTPGSRSHYLAHCRSAAIQPRRPSMRS